MKRMHCKQVLIKRLICITFIFYDHMFGIITVINKFRMLSISAGHSVLHQLKFTRHEDFLYLRTVVLYIRNHQNDSPKASCSTHEWKFQYQLSSSTKLIAELLICLLYQWIKATHFKRWILWEILILHN